MLGDLEIQGNQMEMKALEAPKFLPWSIEERSLRHPVLSWSRQLVKRDHLSHSLEGMCRSGALRALAQPAPPSTCCNVSQKVIGLDMIPWQPMSCPPMLGDIEIRGKQMEKKALEAPKFLLRPIEEVAMRYPGLWFDPGMLKRDLLIQSQEGLCRSGALRALAQPALPSTRCNASRNVVGSDKIFFLHNGIVTTLDIVQPLCNKDLIQKYPSPMHFCWNKNLHNLPQQLRGVLVYYQGKIVAIVKAIGQNALGMQLLPTDNKGKCCMINLFHEGFFLQQLQGAPVAPPQLVRQKLAGRCYHPTMMQLNEQIKMSPDGPDCVNCRLPPQEFAKLFKKDSFIMKEAHVRQRRRRHCQNNHKQSPTVHVVYVKGTQQRYQHAKETFLIPFGNRSRMTDR